MREQAAKQFDAEQIVRRHRLSELEQQIRDLRDELDQRKKDSEAIIDKTVEQFKRNAARYGGRGKDGKSQRDREGGSKPQRRDDKGGKTGNETQAKQKEIVEIIEELIKKAEDQENKGNGT